MRFVYIILFLIGTGFTLQAQPFSDIPSESDYYQMVTLPIPEGIVLEVGGLTTLPDGNIAAATRRGDVWIIENAYMARQSVPFFRHFAGGLHEPLGLAYRDGALYAAQRGELTRMIDTNGDQKADRYESVYSWPLSGHYHEYSYGPVFADDGSMFCTGNVAFGNVEWWRGESRVPWRGWAMRISPDGTMEPWATGMRSPCGIGIIDGEFFYADNQGDWQGSGGLIHVEKGDFTGHPAGLRWTHLAESPVEISTEDIYTLVDPKMAKPGETPIKPENDTTETIALFEVAEKVEGIKTPAVWLPHSVLGISTAQFIRDETDGAFGPFEGQLFVGDQGQSKLVRVFLEKVNGVYQGAAFAFREGFQSGALRMTWGKDGSLFVGQTNRGWGSSGPDPYGLQRLVWTGKTPFEMKSVRAMPDGFEIEFTQPVDKQSASDPGAYQINSFIYKYHPVYGSPIVHDEVCQVSGVVVSKDGMKARLVVDNLRQKFVHEINATGVRSYYDEQRLLHPTAYYTLNEIPEGEKISLSSLPAAHRHRVAPVAPHPPAAPAAPRQEKATSAQTTPSLEKRETTLPHFWAGGPDQTVQLGTLPGLQYDQKLITVRAGAKIKWTFNNNDDMPHNCVIVKPGTADQVGDQAIQLGIKGMNLGYIPPSDHILYHTQLMQPGTAESIYFVAPTQPGDYTYVCTVPGHAQIMRGTLRVVGSASK